jgi:dTDP-4-dehydrorhamnose reductase
MRKKKILITGINGLLGSTLKQVFEKEDYDIYGTNIDISDAKMVNKFAIKNKTFDWIIHTAAITNIDICERDKVLCYNVNFEGTKNIKNLAKTTKAKLIYISTVSVFSGLEGNYKENDLPYPKNFYNLTKLLGEQIISEYKFSLIIRLNLIGIHLNGSRGQNFFEWLVDSIKNNKNIKLFSDVIINPLSNWTVAEIINELIKNNVQEKILHIGSKNVLSKGDIGKLVIEKFKDYKGKVTFINIDNIMGSAFRAKQMWLNTDYVQKKIGLKMPSLEEEIEKILKNSTLL